MKYFWAINIEKSTTMKWMVKGQEDHYCLTIDKNKKRVKYRRQRRRYMSHRTRLYYFHQFWYMLWEMALYDFKPLNVPSGFYQKKNVPNGWVIHHPVMDWSKLDQTDHKKQEMEGRVYALDINYFRPSQSFKSSITIKKNVMRYCTGPKEVIIPSIQV